MKQISLNRFLNKKYKEYPFEGEWKASFGNPEKGSRWLIYGGSGEGKTDFAVQLIKYMSQFDRAAYLSREQGDSSSLQLCYHRHAMKDCSSKIKLLVDGDFDSIMEYLRKRKSCKIIVIDSVDYLNLTEEQYKIIDNEMKGRTLIFIAWKEGKRPQSAVARKIEYMVDVKIEVRHFVAKVRSRYQGNEDFIIWYDGARKHYPHLNL